MTTSNYPSAILRWREAVERQEGELSGFEEPATISTILFGCNRWLEAQSVVAVSEDAAAIRRIKAELERMARRARENLHRIAAKQSHQVGTCIQPSARFSTTPSLASLLS